MVKDVSPVLAYEEVGIAVIVVVSPNAAETVTGAWDAGFVSDIGEGAIFVIAINSVLDGNAAVVAVTAVHKINVLPAVSVEVRHADSRPEFLQVDGSALVALEM